MTSFSLPHLVALTNNVLTPTRCRRILIAPILWPRPGPVIYVSYLCAFSQSLFFRLLLSIYYVALSCLDFLRMPSPFTMLYCTLAFSPLGISDNIIVVTTVPRFLW